MNILPRRLGLLVATGCALLGLIATPAPAASAAPGPTPPAPAAPGPAVPRHVPPPAAPVANFAARPCRPAHEGRNWRWDDTRRGGHWDHREWNWRTWRWTWRHDSRDDRFCAPNRSDGRPNRSDDHRPGTPAGMPHRS